MTRKHLRKKSFNEKKPLSSFTVVCFSFHEKRRNQVLVVKDTKKPRCLKRVDGLKPFETGELK